MIHNPEILILDEPANGLDPEGIWEVREMFRDLSRNHGVTIFISSHILGEISKFATRIGIIDHGRLMKELNTHQLEHLCQKRLMVNTRNNEFAKSILLQNGIQADHSSNKMLVIQDDETMHKPESVSEILVKHKVPPIMLNIVEEDLESYFLRTIKMKGDNI